MKPEKEPSQNWSVVFDEEARVRARTAIDLLYPQRLLEPLSPARRDILGWYQRWIKDLERNPWNVLGAPPLGTDHPNIARFPADENLPISGIADVDLKNRIITVIDVRIRPPRRQS